MLQPYEEKHPKVGDSYVHETAVLIGDVQLGDQVSVWPGAVLRGDILGITVGSYTSVQDNAVLHTDRAHGLHIGQRCTIGHGAILHACTVEDEVLIGMGSILLSGAVVGKGAIVAAGSLVPQDAVLEPGMVYMGSPARAVRPVTLEETAHQQEEIDFYWRLAQVSALSQTNDL